MAIYKFKITFEDYDEVCREIEIKSNQSFEDLHRAIHAAIGFDGLGVPYVLAIGMWLLALLGTYTVIQRMLIVKRAI